MIDPNVFEDCRNLIERDHESWKSYFSKWEVFAKYEENIPENELLNGWFDKIKSVKKKKKVKQSSKKKSHKVSSLIFQKDQKHKKKHFRMIKVSPKNNSVNKANKDYINFKSDNAVADSMNNQMEIILKSVFTNFLRDNINNLEVFAVLSQTKTKTKKIDSNQLFSPCQQALSCGELQSSERNYLIMNQHISPSAMSSRNIHNMSICPARDECIQNFRKNFNFFDFYSRPITHNNKMNSTENLILDNIFPKCGFYCECYKNHQRFLMPVSNNEAPQQSIQTNFDMKICHPIVFDDSKYKNARLKLFKWDYSHKSPANEFRKISKEYFNKKTFPKMNITQDEKRFKNLCLHERTNCASLSMENLNFVTPERKPSERKCFSENVLQRKRGRPSKLFFDNEEENSESDDQTQNQAPLIYCRNKTKSQVIPKVMDDESDSDNCESIFDRVKK